MIEVINVTHHYGVRPVLENISLSVGTGELIALMGPNGMGKSTLMSVIAGTLWPIKGHVTIDGLRRRASEENEIAIRQKVVYLPATHWLPTGHSGRTWLLAIGRLYGIDDDQLLPHVDRLLDVFNLTEQADGLMRWYSTGQQKKIALCGALVAEAPVMLLDEPFAGGLDPSGILALKRILQHHLQRRDRTVLIATPVPELVEEVADRVAVIADGKLIACDTMDALRKKTDSTSLADAYEKLASPLTLGKIDRYFAAEAK